MSHANKIDDAFARDVWCLFGLPIDNLSLNSACELLEQRIREQKENTLATININWVVASLNDLEFRATILESDICTIDGIALLRLAKAFNIPTREAVPGSTLIEHLLSIRNQQQPLSLFLFGGDPGVAEMAYQQVNGQKKGLYAVGAYDPGFGSVEQLSCQEAIAAINATVPNILLLACGARKGQLWIKRNKSRIKANIISHLGATINFLAGTEKRAPLWMRRYGIEWIWRIIQKPSLWKRYAHDGAILLKMMPAHWLSIFLLIREQKKMTAKTSYCDFEVIEEGQQITIKMNGDLNFSKRDYMREQFKQAIIKQRDIVLDFKRVHCVDSSFLGLLLIVLRYQKSNDKNLSLVNMSNKLKKILKYNYIDKSFAAFQYKLL